MAVKDTMKNILSEADESFSGQWKKIGAWILPTSFEFDRFRMDLHIMRISTGVENILWEPLAARYHA